VIKFLKIALVSIVAVAAVGCTRIESGTVGVRVDMSRQIQGNELPAGSWNQTLVGDVLTFPVKDIVVGLENKTPLTSDNSALADFDITLVYGINPSSVAELYTTKSKSFHALELDGDMLLMYTYVSTLVNNASYKAVRGYKALEVADNRAKIEAEIKATVEQQLKEEKLDAAINVSVVQIRNIAPNADIMNAATAYVRSQNELKIKENEVQIAKKESERMAALAQNSSQSIAYMNAQAQLMLAEAAKEGKVNTILIPHGMTMFGGTGK
jgi:regulator of protease activity HflC (stomatin/prohibitin superfamily)